MRTARFCTVSQCPSAIARVYGVSGADTCGAFYQTTGPRWDTGTPGHAAAAGEPLTQPHAAAPGTEPRSRPPSRARARIEAAPRIAPHLEAAPPLPRVAVEHLEAVPLLVVGAAERPASAVDSGARNPAIRGRTGEFRTGEFRIIGRACPATHGVSAPMRAGKPPESTLAPLGAPLTRPFGVVLVVGRVGVALGGASRSRRRAGSRDPASAKPRARPRRRQSFGDAVPTAHLSGAPAPSHPPRRRSLGAHDPMTDTMPPCAAVAPPSSREAASNDAHDAAEADAPTGRAGASTAVRRSLVSQLGRGRLDVLSAEDIARELAVDWTGAP